MTGDARRRLVQRLGHRFADESLLELALTHRSIGARNNERLEFLGDSILNLIITESLYRAVPRAHEGSLTRRRAALVRRETLAALARELALGPSLQLGSGELKSGGRDRDSILANAMEAVVGAVYLDAGLETCRDWLLELYAERLSDAAGDDSAKDPKTQLQETLQARGLPLPDYSVVEIRGAAHEREFTVQCDIGELALTTRGTGSSRRKAEQIAAAEAIEQIDRA